MNSSGSNRSMLHNGKLMPLVFVLVYTPNDIWSSLVAQKWLLVYLGKGWANSRDNPRDTFFAWSNSLLEYSGSCLDNLEFAELCSELILAHHTEDWFGMIMLGAYRTDISIASPTTLGASLGLDPARHEIQPSFRGGVQLASSRVGLGSWIARTYPIIKEFIITLVSNNSL